MQYKRNEKIELLRVISCLLVICIHVSNYYSRGYGKISESSYIVSIIINGYSRVAVPIFFMISGYLLIHEHIAIKKSLRRVIGTAWILIFWSGVYCIWNFFYRDKIYDLQLLFEEPVKKHLWFLYAILGMYIALPFLQCLLKNMPPLLMKYFVLLWVLFLTVNYVLALLDMEVTYQVPLVGSSCYLGYFIMGYLIRCFEGRIPVKKWECVVIALVAGMITVAATYLYTDYKGFHVERFFEYRNILIGISATAVFIGVLQGKEQQLKKNTLKLIRCISRHSLTIYLSHILFLDIIKKECNPRGLFSGVGIILYVGIVFVITFVFSVIFDRISGKIQKIVQAIIKGKPAENR